MKILSSVFFLILVANTGICQINDSCRVIRDSLESEIFKKSDIIDTLRRAFEELQSRIGTSRENQYGASKVDIYNRSILKGFLITSENDIFFPIKNRDENYTGQVRLDLFLNGRLTPDWKCNTAGIPFLRNKINYENNLESVFFNAMGYTPSRQAFRFETPVLNERPYASFVSLGYQRTAWWEWVRSSSDTSILMNTSELQIGKMGINLMNRWQNWIHDYITPKAGDVNGWDNQIAYPGKTAFFYRNYGRWMWSRKSKIPLVSLCGINYDVVLGNFMVYGQFGLNISNRIGALSSFTQLGNIAALASAKDKHFLFGYQINIDYRLVGWNSTLNGLGKNDDSVHKIPITDTKRGVFWPSIKLFFVFQRIFDTKDLLITYQIHGKTLESVGGKPWHHWGSFSVGLLKKKNALAR